MEYWGLHGSSKYEFLHSAPMDIPEMTFKIIMKQYDRLLDLVWNVSPILRRSAKNANFTSNT